MTGLKPSNLSHFELKSMKTCSKKPELCLTDLPDVVVDGVLQGLYPRDVRVSFTAPDLTEPDPTPSIDV